MPEQVPIAPHRSGGWGEQLRRPGVWVPALLVLAVIAVALWLLLTRGGDGAVAAPSPSPSATPSPTASASSTLSPTPEPTATAALVDGFAPVPQLPLEAVPWDVVGPGWFAVDYSSEDGRDSIDDTGFTDLEQRHGGLSLVSPDGDWYAARTHAELGRGPVLGWDGPNAWVARDAYTNMETVLSHAELVDLATGTTTPIPDTVAPEVVAVADGKALDYAYIGDGLGNTAVGVGVEGMGGCTDAGSRLWGWGASGASDKSYLYSAADGGRLVCFGPADDGSRTYVTLVDVADVANSSVIATFKLPAQRYSFVGWEGADAFLFARTAENEPGAEAMFRYDLNDGALAEVDLPMYSDVTGYRVAGYYLPGVGRHVITRYDDEGWSVDLFDADGGAVATVSETCPDEGRGRRAAEVVTSGSRLLVRCDSPGYVAMYSLEDGAEIGRWDLGRDKQIDVFDHRDR